MRYSVKHNHRLPDFTRWMDDIFGELDRTVGGNGANSVPQVNISESDDQFEISLAAPGFHKEISSSIRKRISSRSLLSMKPKPKAKPKSQQPV